jgi:hypothetical protein
MAGRPKNTEPSKWRVKVKRWDFVQVEEVEVDALTWEEAVARVRSGKWSGKSILNSYTEDTDRNMSVVDCRKA